MSPMTMSDLIALCALAVAAISQIWAMQRTSKAHAAEQRGIVDKLDAIGGDVREVKGSLAALRDAQTAQGQTLAALSAQVDGHEQRLRRIETRCDARTSAGGTD